MEKKLYNMDKKVITNKENPDEKKFDELIKRIKELSLCCKIVVKHTGGEEADFFGKLFLFSDNVES